MDKFPPRTRASSDIKDLKAQRILVLKFAKLARAFTEFIH